ncbi:Cytosolic phospholipase A2 delta, partial [Chytriomyces hyalinus]
MKPVPVPIDYINKTIDRLTRTVETLMKAVSSSHNNNNQSGHVAQVRTRTGVKLCDAELAFRKRRSLVAASAMTSLLSRDGSSSVTVRPEHVPIIGIAASGGGCRAMVATLASLNELKSIGILDVTTYIAGVS